MERECLMVTVACVQCADPIVMGPWSVEEVHFLTNEQWGKNLTESTICNACINATIVAEDKRLDDIDDLAHMTDRYEARYGAREALEDAWDGRVWPEMGAE